MLGRLEGIGYYQNPAEMQNYTNEKVAPESDEFIQKTDAD